MFEDEREAEYFILASTFVLVCIKEVGGSPLMSVNQTSSYNESNTMSLLLCTIPHIQVFIVQI
jgi:hypothetical protein